MKKLSSIIILFFTGFLLFATDRLIVDNIEVKDFKNATDILGDGTAVFDPATSTLTLNKVHKEKLLNMPNFQLSFLKENLPLCSKGKTASSWGQTVL